MKTLAACRHFAQQYRHAEALTVGLRQTVGLPAEPVLVGQFAVGPPGEQGQGLIEGRQSLVGVETGVDMWKLMDLAEEVVYPLMTHKVRVDRDSLTLGYAGVYSSFLLHAKRAAEKYGLKSTDILVELGRLKTVGGQEDMIEDVALDMKKAGTAK